MQQQIEIETNVHDATADFLRHLSIRLQEQSINWGGRRDEDLSSKEQDLEHLKANHARDAQRLKEMEDLHGKELRMKQVWGRGSLACNHEGGCYTSSFAAEP